jgi:hypothetical protein
MSDDTSNGLPNVIASQSSHLQQQPVTEPLNMSQLLQTYLEMAGFRSNTGKDPNPNPTW